MFHWIFGGVFVLVGLVPIALARTAFVRDRAIARWPRVPGKVTSSRVETRTSRSRDQQGFYRDYTVHQPIVEFTYTVAGAELKGDQIARESYWSTTKPDLSRYPPGADVLVYYDPDNPRTAYLELDFSIGAVILCVLGSVFITIGVLVAVLVSLA